VAGVILTAVGLEQAALHPDEPLGLSYRTMLFGGIAFFVGGIAIAIYRAFGVIARERLVGLTILGVIVFGADDLHSVWLIVILVLVGLVGLGIEHVRIEVRPSGDRPAVHHTHD
jgi:hypothetical protein